MNEKIKQYSRDLRNNSTTGEITLWSKVLRAKKMYGYQFNRQFVIEYYIVDFVCRKLKLIIEVDGYSHNFTAFIFWYFINNFNFLRCSNGRKLI